MGASKPIKIIAAVVATVVMLIVTVLGICFGRDKLAKVGEWIENRKEKTTIQADNENTEEDVGDVLTSELSLEEDSQKNDVTLSTSLDKTHPTGSGNNLNAVGRPSGQNLSYIDVWSYPQKTSYYVGDSFSTGGLKIAAHYENGMTVDITDDVVIVNPDMYNPGTKNVEVKYTDVQTRETKSCYFDIIIARPTITISKSSLKIKVDSGAYLSANTKPSGVSVTWKTAASSIAKVSGSGYVTGVGSGTTTVTASFIYNGITYTSDSCLVEVEKKASTTKPASQIGIYDVYWNEWYTDEEMLYIYDMDGYVSSNYNIKSVVVGLIGPVYINGKYDELNQSYTFDEDYMDGKTFYLDPQGIWGEDEFYDFDIIAGEEYEFYIRATDEGGGVYEDSWSVTM